MRKVHLLTLLVVLALVISGAGAALARQEVTLTLMGWSSSTAENDALMAQVEAFMAANPGIKVNVNLVPEYDTTIQAAFAAGDPPNVFYVDSSRLPDWAEAGVLASGEGKIENLEEHYESLLEAFTYNGTLYCPPKDFSIMALQYNKDMFDAAGLEYPTPDWTWEDLRAAAEKLTGTDAEGRTVLGLVTPPNFERWLPFLYQAGGSVLNEDWTEVTLDSDEAREALEFYVGMVRCDCWPAVGGRCWLGRRSFRPGPRGDGHGRQLGDQVPARSVPRSQLGRDRAAKQPSGGRRPWSSPCATAWRRTTTILRSPEAGQLPDRPRRLEDGRRAGLRRHSARQERR